MAKRDFAFGKENFILIAVAVAVIAIGFMLMSGGGSQDPTGFNPEIFSSRRIVVAPAVTVIGFVLVRRIRQVLILRFSVPAVLLWLRL